MVNILVVYQSNTGFTRQYAEWIAEDLNCPVMPIVDVRPANIQAADLIIYGGWVMANQITDLKHFQENQLPPLIVFAVGASPASDQVSQDLNEANQLGDTPFYYFQGGLRREQLSWSLRLMLRVGSFVMKRQAKKDQRLQETVALMNQSNEAANRQAIAPLVAKAKTFRLHKDVVASQAN